MDPTKRINIAKGDKPEGDDEEKTFRLTGIEPDFVALVTAGANRQREFQVVKSDEQGLGPGGKCVCTECGFEMEHATGMKCNEQKCPKCGAAMTRKDDGEDEIPEDFDMDAMEEHLAKFTGSPRNRFGTHSSYKFKGNYAEAWKLHFSQHAGGKPGAAATGPIRGTVRRVEMIAAAMKPVCKLPTTDDIPARGGDDSPLTGTYPETPSAYGLSAWDKPEDEKDREGMKLSCSDLEVIKRAALAEVKRRAEDAEKKNESGKAGDSDADEGDGNNNDGSGNSDTDAIDLTSWLEEAGDKVDDLSLDNALQRALDAQADDDSDASASSKEAEINNTDSPTVAKVGEEVQDEEDPRDAKIAELEAKLKKQSRELNKAKAKSARLAKGVGQSSVMVTGEFTSADRQQPGEQESPSKGTFSSGGDMSAAVAGKG